MNTTESGEKQETRLDFLTRAALNHLGDYAIKGVIVREDVNNLVVEARLLQQQLSKERELRKELEDGIRKYVHHMRRFFGEPKVGQPPDLKDLENLLTKF